MKPPLSLKRIGIVYDSQGSNALAKNHGTVVMSPTHAKAFLEAFQSTIKQFEEKFGEIDLGRIREATEGKVATMK
jgi:hypothetical protein